MGCNASKPTTVHADNQNTTVAPYKGADAQPEQDVPVAVEAEKPVEAEQPKAEVEKPKAEAEEAKPEAVAEEKVAEAPVEKVEEAAPVVEEVKDEVVVVAEKAEKTTEEKDLSTIFYDAHTAHGFLDKPVDDALLQKAVELAQLAPTAFNCCPMRVVFVKSPEGKEKLVSCVMEGNAQQTKEAPVTAIVCFDSKFYEKLPELCPVVEGLAERYASNPSSAENTMTRNGNLQGGYLTLALRSLGLDVGPMSGFDNNAVDSAFLANDEDSKEWKSNFLINIGYANPDKNYPRAPRLAFDVASQFA